jgi:hypothetical protein
MRDLADSRAMDDIVWLVSADDGRIRVRTQHPDLTGQLVGRLRRCQQHRDMPVRRRSSHDRCRDRGGRLQIGKPVDTRAGHSATVFATNDITVIAARRHDGHCVNGPYLLNASTTTSNASTTARFSATRIWLSWRLPATTDNASSSGRPRRRGRWPSARSHRTGDRGQASATEACRIADRTGRLRVCLSADLVAVDGGPCATSRPCAMCRVVVARGVLFDGDA